MGLGGRGLWPHGDSTMPGQRDFRGKVTKSADQGDFLTGRGVGDDGRWKTVFAVGEMGLNWCFGVGRARPRCAGCAGRWS